MATEWFKRSKVMVPRGRPSDPHRVEAELLLRRFERLVLQDHRSRFLERLIGLHILLATLALVHIVVSGDTTDRALLVWLSLLGVGAGSFWILSREKTRVAIELTAGLSGAVAGMWLLPLALLAGSTSIELGMMLALWALCVLHVPFSLPMGAGVGVVVFGVTTALAEHEMLGSTGAIPLFLWFSMILVIISVGVRSSRIGALQSTTAIAQHTVNDYCSSVSSSALTTLRLVASSAKAILETRRALVVSALGASEIVEGNSLYTSRVDSSFARALSQRLSEGVADVGTVSVRSLGDQYTAPLYDWFGKRPSTLVFIRFMMVLEEREQAVFVILPRSLTCSIVAMRRVLVALHGVRGLAQVSFAAARGRFIASDALLLSQRAAMDREKELSELVHLVNNVAQDIGMQCEVVSDLVTEGIRDPSLLATRESIVAEIRDLETSSRYLSAGVSDATLLHELLRIRSFSRQEDVLLNTVLDDLNSYAAHRRKRRGVAVRVEKHEHDKTTVSVTSREFLDTCLRGLLKECFASGDPGAEVVVRAFDDRESVAIEFSGFAAFDELGQDEEKPILAATQRFAELSGGKLYVFPGEAPYCSRFLLVLKRGAAVKKRTISHGRWALFVDDNPQVTGFYGRIAEAFSLPFMSASSVTEAVKILDTEGSPRFVMTDLQLGEESGLDLVRELRTRFGRDLVVIVISGNLSEEVRAAVQEVGATRFLAKPVGRSRLVAEFQGIMGER